MIEPAAALVNWARWAVDGGSWRETCYSAEGRYSRAEERYVFADDAEKRLRPQYDPRIGEQVERLINRLPDQEKLVLRARHVNWPRMADDMVARRLAMSARSFDTVLLSATVRFGKLWREQRAQRQAA
ncbi:hypothetical protein LQD23_08440 [Chromobacterium violaceum]|uniref:hypothetical protein n=1 Tax=Chromobacterium violaceum TaxID=536 RepID=UPI001E518C6C|nr:hypothetical protein [Chromobacterium violaceum]MCD0492324.1 hypothetical protein [Chromobacterium violaceum]